MDEEDCMQEDLRRKGLESVKYLVVSFESFMSALTLAVGLVFSIFK